MAGEHELLTGNQLHEAFHYVQSSDPGAVGAGKYWLDTTSEPYVLNRRNATDDDWVRIGALDGLPADADYTDISANDADTDVTGAELEELTDGSETTLHSHPGGGGGFTPDRFVLPIFVPDANTSWNTIGSPDNQGHALLSAGTINNEITWNINLPSGTYTIAVKHSRANNRGIYHLYVAGSDVGNFDGYNAATVFAVNSVTGISVSAGVTAIKLKMEAKNGSSPNYFGVVYGVEIYKTA